MTREELKEHCQRQIQQFERVEKIMPVTLNDWKRYEEHKLILELLEQEPTTKKDLGVDAISRKAVDRLAREYLRKPTDENTAFYEHFLELPTVTPREPILDKIRAEIIKYEGDCRLSVDEYPSCKQCTDNVFETIYGIIDKYKAESEE